MASVSLPTSAANVTNGSFGGHLKNGTNTSVNSNHGSDFEFIPPPECPIFYPTEEEFAMGPLEYISKIRAEAEPHGICKIIPPNTFQPPFAVAVEEFRFTPRIQRLNELEATTRIKLNFIEQIVKFWDLQGASFKIPTLERRSLDLYNLHKIVAEEGGFEICTRDRKWSRVATRMGYGNNSSSKGTIASLLRQHYERILFPYDVFQSGATIGPDIEEKCDSKLSDEEKEEDKNKNPKSSDKEATTPEKRILRRQSMSPSNQNPLLVSPNSQNKELRKLQVYGAGPKMPGYVSEQTDQSVKVCLHCGETNPQPMLLTCDNCSNTYHTHCLIPPLNDWPKGVWHCHRCLALLVQSYPQPYTQEFGFVQSQKSYTLSEFGEMADQFKADYFNCPPHSVTHSLAEKEFWRLVSAIEESVTVEYGADLHTNDYGSGFPTKTTKNLLPSDMEYINHLWNLNNIPVLEGSVFRHINANISGMIVPWMYVGMCFATFCWHNEDHWTYSINYLHWGEPKTWYGVPGEHAETFERAMKRAAPELFKSQPDLLHQLVTICNPNILMQDGVPVYRCNQQAGEFVVTFPRSYHTGFNQGLNFAEAVNFAPSDWLPIGRVCITHYAMLHRFPVFSHDELICKMANDPNHLEITLAVETYKDMLRMVESEKSSRLGLLEWGVTQAEREAFELLADDERQCDYCKTTCFLSALTCSCTQSKIVCLTHKDNLCKTCLPSQHTLRYRYTLDELPIMLHHLRKRAEKFDDWASNVQTLLKKIDTNTDLNDCNEPKVSPTLKELKSSLNDAVVNKYPTNSEIYEHLNSIVSEASKCSRAAKDLLKQQETLRKQQLNVGSQHQTSPVKRTLRSTAGRNANAGLKDNVNIKLTLEEISLFYDEVEELQCEIPEKQALKQLLDRCNSIAASIMSVLNTNNTKDINESLKSSDLEAVLFDAQSIVVVDFGPQLEAFRHKLEEIRWLEECDAILITKEDVKPGNQKKYEISTVKTLIENTLKLAVNTDVINSKLNELQQIVDESNKWMERAANCFVKTESESETNSGKPLLSLLESLIDESENNVYLKQLVLSPQIDNIRVTVQKARNWISQVNDIFGNDYQKHSSKGTSNTVNSGDAPMIEAIEELVVAANGIDCQLTHLANLDSTITASRQWKDRLNRAFTKKNSLYTIIQILSPRIASMGQTSDCSFTSRTLFHYLKRLSSQTQNQSKLGKSPNLRTQPKSLFETQLGGENSRTHIAALYKLFEEQELNHLRSLRKRNSTKRLYLERKAIDLVDDTNDTDEEQKRQALKFCICGKEEDEWMVECQLCFDWFHNKCIQNSQSLYMRKKQQINQQILPNDWPQPQQHMICDLCSRGKRPKVDSIVNLLCSLQKLPVRLLEGELLQCLAERAIKWQNKLQSVRNSHSDLDAAYKRIEKLQSDSNRESQQTDKTDDLATEEATAQALLALQRSQPTVNLEIQSPNTSTIASNDSIISSQELSPLKNKRKSPLVLRAEAVAQPIIELSAQSLEVLSELLFEVNCLEVSLEETSNLWLIWHMSQPNYRTVLRNLDSNDNNIEENKRKSVSESIDSETQNKKKKQMISKDKNIKNIRKNGKKGKSDDSDELCEMKDKCLKPNVAQVDWVQCEGQCQGWYHQLCIGIESPDQIEALEKFFCINCKPTD
ncbi:lysine-specific demethylase 5C-like isoform X2 [Oppia nitens]|uniref:lysine-specific demethylase 5C-like isoform X2 n=1 Tax=Oppia nitens TaxID=1686743 RepID=UPI0023D9AD89|nr:lysine-specific demethylase 5C-like isoform X2 [Oppia nitens]